MIHNFLKSLIGQKIRQILESKNFKLEDKHLGEECYIFGDGVLRWWRRTPVLAKEWAFGRIRCTHFYERSGEWLEVYVV